jgi:hypothetical protein
MKSLRKKPTFNQLVESLSNQPIIRYPERKGINVLDNTMVSNLLFDDDGMDEVMRLDKATQTPHEKGTQTGILEKGVQTPYFIPRLDYEVNPEKYYEIPAFSKYMKPNEGLTNYNDASSEAVKTDNDQLSDNINQTSRYIPGLLQRKSDNINQTVRYMLKTFESPIPTPAPTPIPTPESSEQEIPDYDPEPGWLRWLFPVIPLPSDPGSDPRPPSNPPSVPSASSLGIRSPSESPPSTETSNIPPFSPSPVVYPASEEEPEEEVKSQSKSRSSKSSKGKK